MSSNFQQSIYILTQRGFHRVQEHPKRSSLLSSILILIFLQFTYHYSFSYLLFTNTYFTIHLRIYLVSY